MNAQPEKNELLLFIQEALTKVFQMVRAIGDQRDENRRARSTDAD